MLAELDPVATLPDLAVDHVWLWLSERDLLQCRLVSRAWRRSLEAGRHWRRFIPDCGGWQTYLQIKKAEHCWRRGLFTTNSLSVTTNDKICVGSEYIYIGKGKEVIFYNSNLEVVHCLNFEVDIVSMKASGSLLAVIVRDGGRGKSRYRIYIYNDRKEVYETQGSSLCLGLGEDGTLCWEVEKELRLLEGGSVKALEVPGKVCSIALLEGCVIVLIGHPASHGGGFSVLRTRGGCWDVVYECANSSPMVLQFGELIHSRRILGIIHGTIAESGYSNRIQVHDCSEVLFKATLPEDRRPYFRAAVGSDSIVYTQDDGHITRIALQSGTKNVVKLSSPLVRIHVRQRDQVLVYPNYLEYLRDMSFRYRLDLEHDIIGSAAQERALVLWGAHELTALSIPNQ